MRAVAHKVIPLLIPTINSWIDKHIEKHRPQRKSVASYNFPNLHNYYSLELLQNSFVVEVDTIPTPPLDLWGISSLPIISKSSISGITYKDTYFVVKQAATLESLHFHELVHVIQWETLGAQNFLTQYLTTIFTIGYIDSPFEVMAYSFEESFRKRTYLNNLEEIIQRESQKLGQNFRKI